MKLSTEMRAAEKVIARARDLISSGGRICHYCPRFYGNNTIIPDKEFNALAEALDEYERLAKLSEDESEDGPTRNQKLTRLMK